MCVIAFLEIRPVATFRVSFYVPTFFTCINKELFAKEIGYVPLFFFLFTYKHTQTITCLRFGIVATHKREKRSERRLQMNQTRAVQIPLLSLYALCPSVARDGWFKVAFAIMLRHHVGN